MTLPALTRAFVDEHGPFAGYLRMQDILPTLRLTEDEDDWFDEAFTDASTMLTAFARTGEADDDTDWWCLWHGGDEPAVVLVSSGREVELIAPSFPSFLALLASGRTLRLDDLPLENVASNSGTLIPTWRAELAQLVAWSAGRGVLPLQDPRTLVPELEAVDDALTAWFDAATPW